MHVASALGAAILLAVVSPSFAGAQSVSAELRQQAIDNCGGDAVRLCPASMTSEDAVVACMATKRPQLTKSCRVVYDQVAKLLKE